MLLSDERDLARLKSGVRFLASVLASAPLKGIASDPFPSSWSDRAKKVSSVTARNWILTGILAQLMDGPSTLRRTLTRTFITQGETLGALLAADDLLEDYVKRTVTGNWHCSCTCKMGAEHDPKAVTDPAGRVRGVAGLRVADASVMPSVPCGNTNIPTIMIAEKVSDAILAD